MTSDRLSRDELMMGTDAIGLLKHTNKLINNRRKPMHKRELNQEYHKFINFVPSLGDILTCCMAMMWEEMSKNSRTVYGNDMFYRGKKVDSLPLDQAKKLFIAWLLDRRPCMLIGHNFESFDQPRIILLRHQNSRVK